MSLVAFDVSKDILEGFDGSSKLKIANTPTEIGRMLKRYPSDWSFILEPTSIYHLELAERAYKAGHTVYLVNPRAMSKFRESRSFRAKTDEIDAECLHVFGTKHVDDLRAWSPLAADVEALRRALKQYHKLTQQRVRLVQIMGKSILQEFGAALDALTALVDKIEDEAIAAAKRVDEDYFKRLLAAPGFGNYSACAFTYLFKSRNFETPDAARAFIGMDLKVKDSGKKMGKRCLTKCGDSMLRHAAGCAGRGLLNSKYGREKNLELKAQKREGPARMMIAGAKLVRIAFALHSSGQPFDPTKFKWRLDAKT